MTWNHRVVRQDTPEGPVFTVHEVFYAAEDRITNWTERPVAPLGDSLDELRQEIEMFREACAKPVLVERDGHLVEETQP